MIKLLKCVPISFLGKPTLRTEFDEWQKLCRWHFIYKDQKTNKIELSILCVCSFFSLYFHAFFHFCSFSVLYIFKIKSVHVVGYKALSAHHAGRTRRMRLSY